MTTWMVGQVLHGRKELVLFSPTDAANLISGAIPDGECTIDGFCPNIVGHAPTSHPPSVPSTVMHAMCTPAGHRRMISHRPPFLIFLSSHVGERLADFFFPNFTSHPRLRNATAWLAVIEVSPVY